MGGMKTSGSGPQERRKEILQEAAESTEGKRERSYRKSAWRFRTSASGADFGTNTGANEKMIV
jgi:hypothetical protein